MKKLWNLAFGYFLAAMAGGVFYREFTKYFGFTGETALGYLHVHLLVLGTVLLLFLGLAAKSTDLLEKKQFHTFVTVYNIILPLFTVVMLVRGILQVTGVSVSHGADAAISGIAGLTNIAIAGAWIFLFTILRKLK